MLNFDLMDTVAGRQIYDEGAVEAAREMLTVFLRERFGVLPEEVTRGIYALGHRDVFTRLMAHAANCQTIGDFREMLAKMTAV